MQSKASFVTTPAKFIKLIEQSALANTGGDPKYLHSDVHLSIDGGYDNPLETLNNYKSGAVLTYNSFSEDYFEEIEGAVDVVFNAEKMLEYLKVASGSDRMRVTFLAPEDSNLAEQVEAEGSLQMGVSTKASSSAMDIVPDDLPSRWDESNNFLSPSGNTHQTFIDTTAKQISEKIIEAVDLQGGDEYPITVEDEEFKVDVGDDFDYHYGDLSGSVRGEDVANEYRPGFVSVFQNTLSGDVQLQTTEGQPMAVVSVDSEAVYRHVLAPV